MKPARIILTFGFLSLMFSACKQDKTFFNTVNVSVYDPGTGGALNRISFANSSEGYISASNGKILKTTNQGGSWTVKTVGTSDLDLRSLSTPSASAIYASGQNGLQDGYLYKSTDSGDTWVSMPGNWDFDLVDFPSTTRGYMISTGELYRTTNGGSLWNYVNGLGTVDPQVLAFASNDSGVVVGFDDDSYFTDDGGTSVTQVGLGSSTGKKIICVKFVSATQGYAIDYQGGIQGTNDAGQTWSELRYQSDAVGEDYGTSSIDAYGSTICAVGEGTLLISKDGGATFNNYLDQNGISVYDTFTDVAVVASNKIIAVASSGKIYTITF